LQPKSRQEVVESLDNFMTDAFKHWQNKHGSYPQLVIIFRDGVGDTMMDTVVSLFIIV